MSGFDWAAGDYLSEALDAAERRADKAEDALSEQSSGRSNIGSTIVKTLASAGTAGALGWWGGASGGMLAVGGKVPVNLLGGLAAKAIALFAGRHVSKIHHSAPGILDAMGTGAVDQFAAMRGYFAGQATRKGAAAKGAATAGAQAGRSEWHGAHPPHAPAMGGGAAHPTDYMTPDQRRVWESYAP